MVWCVFCINANEAATMLIVIATMPPPKRSWSRMVHQMIRCPNANVAPEICWSDSDKQHALMRSIWYQDSCSHSRFCCTQCAISSGSARNKRWENIKAKEISNTTNPLVKLFLSKKEFKESIISYFKVKEF